MLNDQERAALEQRLETAQSEIREVLSRHKIAGNVFIYDQFLGMQFAQFETPDSLIVHDGERLGFLLHTDKFDGDEEKMAYAIAYNLSMFEAFSNLMRNEYRIMRDVKSGIENTLKGRGFEPPEIDGVRDYRPMPLPSRKLH